LANCYVRPKIGRFINLTISDLNVVIFQVWIKFNSWWVQKNFFLQNFLHKLCLSCEELPTFVIIQKFLSFKIKWVFLFAGFQHLKFIKSALFFI
jgi:hypothetical protein